MKPSAPKKILWVIALIVGILGIIAHFIHIEYITEYNFWLVLIGYVILVLGTSFKGI
jgi:purine-cytosine permease-like protein